MSMSHYACHGDIVEENFVKEICPDEFNKLQEFLKNHNSDIGEFAHSNQLAGEFLDLYDDDNPDISLDKECEKLWEELKGTFERETGLTLDIGYFDGENRLDGMMGVYWSVKNVYILTEAGRKYSDRITRKSWCACG